MTKNKYLTWILSILIMLVFCIPAFTRVLLHQDNILYLVWSIVLCVPLVYALQHIRSKIVFCILFFCLMMLSGTEMFFSVGLRSLVQTAHIIGIMTSTDKESSHFMDNNMLNMASTLPQLLCGIAAMVIRCIQPGKCPRTRTLRIATWAGLLCAAGLGMYMHVAPYNIIKCCALAARQGYTKHRMVPMAQGMTFNATRPDTGGREYYVMCVGESLRAANLGINGYGRQTTPLLQSLDNMVSFTDYYSNATLTMYSVPMMLSRATVDDYDINYTEYGILKPYRECGFKTIVISPGKLLTYERYLTHGADTVYNVRNDSVIPALIDSLTQVHPKVFFLVQLYQSHLYFDNFTPQYDAYRPNLATDGGPGIPATDELMVNAYDNTVLYTDYIMSSMIRAIDKPDARSAFLFASDHGEVLELNKPGRGCALNPDKDEYHVAMMFWSSDLWTQTHRDAARRIKEISHQPINADYLFYTACDMADITIDSIYWKPEYSLLSPEFKTHERKIMLPDGLSVLRPEAKR